MPMLAVVATGVAEGECPPRMRIHNGENLCVPCIRKRPRTGWSPFTGTTLRPGVVPLSNRISVPQPVTNRKN